MPTEVKTGISSHGRKGKKEPTKKVENGSVVRRWLARSMDACVESFSLGDCFIASRQNEQLKRPAAPRTTGEGDVRIKLKTEKILLNILITLWLLLSDRFIPVKEK